MESSERFKEVQKLRSGSFAQVIEALDTEACPARSVALKRVPRHRLVSKYHRDCVQREILLHLKLRHPHVIQLREVHLDAEHLLLVLELAGGGDLAQRVPPGAGLDESQARWHFQQLLFALEFVHRMGVAHRDIKLENVLLDSPTASLPLVKLADFGLSVECDAAGRAPFDGAVGTPVYMAPELLERLVSADLGDTYDAKAADVWSCGVLLLALLTGCSPFQRMADAGLSEGRKMKALVRRIFSLDCAIPTNLSPACIDLVNSMLQRDPASRPTARALLQHRWFKGALDAEALTLRNDYLVASRLASPPAPEVLTNVQGLLAEACGTSPATPQPSCSAACLARWSRHSSEASESGCWNNECEPW